MKLAEKRFSRITRPRAPAKPGRKPFVPSGEQRRYVEEMTGFGIPQVDIARLIINPQTGAPIDEKTLRLHFAEEIATGLAKANAAVARSLFTEATAGEDPRTRISAAMFWLSRRAAWKETTINQHEGKDGGPIIFKISNDDSKL